MTPESVMSLGGEAMQITLMVAAPILLTVLIIGLVVSIFQAATQINEQTLSYIPKLVGVFVALIFTGPWM
ncbi:MAG TPA: flagellar biosynthesis protein FliQ, partial [Methylotenera sp.]|nr:flagellar biosynthesis protein FliQ [Methylotenera sp.]